MSTKINQLQRQINQIKHQLMELGDMRPGTLTRQYADPQRKLGGGYQLSYTYQMKSRTEYVRPAFIRLIQEELQNFKKFKQLTRQWIDVALSLSKLKIQIAKDQADQPAADGNSTRRKNRP